RLRERPVPSAEQVRAGKYLKQDLTTESYVSLHRRNTLSITYEPIGTIHSPFSRIEDMPIQPAGALGVRGTVQVRAEFAEGLKDLDGFSHLILLYHFHQV